MPAVDGRDLQTTIDRDLQWYTQRVLRQAVEDSGGGRHRRGDGLAAPARSSPSPTTRRSTRTTRPPRRWPTVEPARSTSPTNRARSRRCSPSRALIDSGKVTARTKMLVPGELRRQDRVIHDHWEHGLIRLTLAGVLAKSSNVGTVLAADRFAPGELRSYLDKFGLGRPTNVGLGAESRGVLPDPTAWTDQVEDRISFGQSLSVNAMQMAAAINTIANDGVRVDPTFIQGEATRDDGMRIGTDVSTTRRVVSAAARQTTRMMELVVDPEDGAAPLANVPGYRVAGKTGTAQRVGRAWSTGSGRAATTAPTPSPSPGSPRPRTPASPSTSSSRRPPTGGGGGVERRAGVLQADGLHAAAVRRAPEPPQQTRCPPSGRPTVW